MNELDIAKCKDAEFLSKKQVLGAHQRHSDRHLYVYIVFRGGTSASPS